MTTRIGGIVVDIDARLAKLEKELARGNRELKRFEQNAVASGSRVEAGLVGISKGVGTLVGVLGGLGIAFAATELIGFGRDALAMADDLATAADQVGIGVERFQTLRQVFRELEVDGDSFDKAMMRLSTTLGDVQSGAVNEATKSLDRMGITARILSGEIDSTDELLDAIADSAKRFGTEAEFTAAVVDIFGRRGGVELAAALRIGSDGIQSMEGDIRRLGTVLTEEQINKLADANESIDKFSQTAKYGFAIFAAESIDALERVGATLDWWEERVHGAVVQLANLAGFSGPRGSREIVQAGLVRDNRNPIDGSDVNRRLGFNITRPVAPARAAPIRPPGAGGGGRGSGVARRSGGGGVREADSFARTMADLTRRTADARLEYSALNEQWDSVTVIDARMRAEALRIEQEQGTRWTELQRQQYRAAADDLRSLAVQTELARIEQERYNDVLAVDGADLPGQSGLPGELQAAAANLPDLRNVWQNTFGNMDDVQRIAFDSLTRNLEGAILDFQSLEDAAKSFASQLASMALQAFVFKPLGAALGIPGFASGTDFAPGGLALVGEKGPELVNLPRGSQVIPNNRLRTMNNPRVQSVGHGSGAAVFNQYFTIPGGVDLATRSEMLRLAEATKASTLSAFKESRRRSSN